MEQQFVTKRIATLEQEIGKLKALVHIPMEKNMVSLKGLFKGIPITEQDLQEAKRSLFKHV